MQNIALLEVIASGLSDSTENRDALLRTQESHGHLSENEVQRIVELAAALDSVDQSIKSDRGSADESSVADESSSHSVKTAAPDKSPIHWKLRVTLPKLAVTIVNDLQGLDEPLLKNWFCKRRSWRRGTHWDAHFDVGAHIRRPRKLYPYS
jgi:hypothetical protein